VLRSYEQAKGEYIPRHEMFQEYTDFCDREGLEKRMAQNIFGKYVRHAFPGIQTKRVGGRGQQIRCYAHLRRAGGGQQPPPQHPPTPQPQRTTTGKKRKSVVKRKAKKNPTKKRKQDSASDPSDERENEESEEKNQGSREQRTRKESAGTQMKMTSPTRRSTRNLEREKEKLQANPKRADHFHQEEEARVEDIREHVPSGKKFAAGPTEQESERILKKRKREAPLLKQQLSPEKARGGLDCTTLPALDAAPSSKGMQLVPVGGGRAIGKRRKIVRKTRKKKSDDEENEEKEDANEGEVETTDKVVAYRMTQDESDDDNIPLFEYLYREYSREEQKRQPFPGKYSSLSFSLSLSLSLTHYTTLIDQ